MVTYIGCIFFFAPDVAQDVHQKACTTCKNKKKTQTHASHFSYNLISFFKLISYSIIF